MSVLRFCLTVDRRVVVPFLALLESLAPRPEGWTVAALVPDPEVRDLLGLLAPPGLVLLPPAQLERETGFPWRPETAAPHLLHWSLAAHPACDAAVWLEPTVHCLVPPARWLALDGDETDLLLFDRASDQAAHLVDRALRSSLLLVRNADRPRHWLRHWLNGRPNQAETPAARVLPDPLAAPAILFAPAARTGPSAQGEAAVQAEARLGLDLAGRLAIAQEPILFLNCRQARLVAPGWLAPGLDAPPASPTFVSPATTSPSLAFLRLALLPWAERLLPILDLLQDTGADALLFSSPPEDVRPDELLLTPEALGAPRLDRDGPPARLSPAWPLPTPGAHRPFAQTAVWLAYGARRASGTGTARDADPAGVAGAAPGGQAASGQRLDKSTGSAAPARTRPGESAGPLIPVLKILRLAQSLLAGDQADQAAALLRGAPGGLDALFTADRDQAAELVGRLLAALPPAAASPIAAGGPDEPGNDSVQDLEKALVRDLEAAPRRSPDAVLALAGRLAGQDRRGGREQWGGGERLDGQDPSGGRDRLAEAVAVCRRHLDLYPDDPAVKPLAVRLHERLLDRRLTDCLVVRPERGGPYAVTVIVSVWRAGRFMTRCLDDLLAQTLAERLEIVILDAASPEGERAVIEDCQRRRPDILYLRAPARNTVYEAWNLAIRAASGRFVLPFSVNDRLHPEACARLAALLEARPEAVLAYGDTLVARNADLGFPEALTSPEAVRQTWGPYDFRRNLAQPMIGPHPLWRRSLHALEGYFDERSRALADQDFFLRLGRRHPFAYLGEPTGLAWLDAGSLSAGPDSVRELAAIQRRWRAVLAADVLGRAAGREP